VQGLIREALREDIGRGDVTSQAVVGQRVTTTACIVSRAPCALSGIRVAARVFRMVDRGLRVRILANDGRRVGAGECVLRVDGKARSILAAERVALNFLQRMTGIATLTRRFADKARTYGVTILDTRKTTPTLRVLEKYAVLCGGGANHRMGLYDRILIKDNHRALWRKRGTLEECVRAARERFPGMEVEVEVEGLSDLKSVLRARPDWVLLDNMPVARIRQCVRLCRRRCRVEASGGITLKNITAVARTGVDAVSVGALTHSAPAADFSLEFCA
jgi:nicotinate-nucleotide pyrophosphorylase (carboxylating)